MFDKQELTELVITNLGQRELTTVEQGGLVQRLVSNSSRRINLAVLNKLSEAEHKELLQLAEEGNREKVRTFLQGKISNLNQLIKQTVIGTVEEFKGLTR
ncbi:MAG: hypothetical protein U9M92_03105 [Patescibacteria group bacterium]|nr:hypothetical protein [Patescibacteria group bacterium]